MRSILIVDDEDNMLDVLSIVFRSGGYSVVTKRRGLEAIAHLRSNRRIDLVLCDFKLPDTDGLEVMKAALVQRPGVPVVIITAYGNIELAVEAMKLGAADFVAKPFTKGYIKRVVGRLLCETSDLGRDRCMSPNDSVNNLIVRSQAMQDILQQAKRVAEFKAPILLVGESGVGKELIARYIHRQVAGSNANANPLVTVNCPAIPHTLIESELFGHRRGAFTGATNDRTGRLQQADGGTLFLDEIGELSSEVQPKLLRVLEERKFQPIGSNETLSFHGRVISATNRELSRMVECGTFREDLLFRINTVTIRIPPLRERREDILPLAEHLLGRYCDQYATRKKGVSAQAAHALQRHSWPGNVRELRNLVERAVILSESETIDLTDFPTGFCERVNERHTQAPERSDGRGGTLEEQEKALLLAALRDNEWNLSATARMLGISRNTLRYRIEKHAIAVPRRS